MTQYASKTSVTPEKSRAEIEQTLRRYGADSFASGWGPGQTMIGFMYNGRSVRFLLPLPDKNDRSITHTPRGKPRTRQQIEREYEQAVRQRWRALSLVIKAKLEAVELGIVTFEDEFMAHIVLPDGSRVGDRVIHWIDEAYELGHVPPLALPMEAGRE